MPRANASVTSIEITGTAQVEARPVIDYFAIDPGDPYEEWMDHDMSNPYTRRRRPATTSDRVIYEGTSGFRVRYRESDGEGCFLFGAYGDDAVLTPGNTVAMARALVEFFQQKYGGESCNENEDSVAGHSPE